VQIPPNRDFTYKDIKGFIKQNVFSTITINTFLLFISAGYGPTSLLVKINPSEHLTEQMTLKDTTIYNKLKADNWEEWEQNTINLLDTRHPWEDTEVNYGLTIERAHQY